MKNDKFNEILDLIEDVGVNAICYVGSANYQDREEYALRKYKLAIQAAKE